MKVKYLLILIISIPVVGLSQINASLDVIGGIEYTFRTLSTTSLDTNMLAVMDYREGETGKINWRAGFNYNQRLNKRLFLKTGLRFAILGYKSKKETNIRWPSENQGGQWVPDPNLYHEKQTTKNYWYIELPVILRYEFSDKKLVPFVELGVAPMRYLGRKSISTTDLGSTTFSNFNRKSNIKTFQIAGVFSFGANYTVNKNFQFFGQPIIRYHLNKKISIPIQDHFYNYGIEIGLRTKLNKT